MAQETCEIVMVRGLEDANGYPCERASTTQCADCGSQICDVHMEECDLCGDSFCASCYYSHMTEPHAKPVLPQRVQPKRERSA
jgi:hypothetical protein